MAILNRLFEKSPSEDIVKSLGNILISGVENEGSRRLYHNILMDFLHEKRTIIMINGSLSHEEYRNIMRFINPHLTDRCCYDLNLSGSGDSFNVLSAFNSDEQKADFVITLMSMVSDMPELLKTKAQRFFLYAISALEAKGKKCTIKDLAMMDIEAVTELVSSGSLPDPEKRRRLRFLSDSSTYSSYMDIESCMVKLESTGMTEMLSGDPDMREMLRDGNIVMLNGMISDDFKKKEMLFNSILLALTKCLEKYGSMSRVSFYIKNADFIAGDHIRNILEYNMSYNFASYIYVEDIAKYLKKNGNSILDASKSFLVFNQGSDENAVFWSAFFGSRDIQEKSYSYTKNKSWNPFAAIMDNGGVIASPRKYSATTTNMQKVNKPIYRPEVFRELRPNEAMIYLREPLVRRRVRIED